jgi:NADH-quinone oxidoreductase subunit I
MSKIRAAAAIAKGMSITFKEMFQPTEVENYPDGKGPMRGAKFQERFRGKHQLQRDENGRERFGEVCRLFPLRRRLPVELYLY